MFQSLSFAVLGEINATALREFSHLSPSSRFFLSLRENRRLSQLKLCDLYKGRFSVSYLTFLVLGRCHLLYLSSLRFSTNLEAGMRLASCHKVWSPLTWSLYPQLYSIKNPILTRKSLRCCDISVDDNCDVLERNKLTTCLHLIE